MDSYALYNFDYHQAATTQNDMFISEDIKVGMSTADKNLWVDRLFGDRNTDVRVQRLKRGVVVDKFPCKVLAHGKGRVVWLRLENEKIRRMWMKHESKSPNEPELISKVGIPENPFSHIFIDLREGRNMIAILKENDAWRDTDVAAHLLQESLNLLMESAGYGFVIYIHPIKVPKDYMEYNRQLILKENRHLKKMTIYFRAGTINPRVTAWINQTPILKRLLKEMWEAKRGKLELYEPFGPKIVDKRKRDIKNIIELIGSNLTDDDFGLSLSYEGGNEVVCGKEIRLFYPMKTDTLSMYFSPNLFGEYKINEWLDGAVEYIKKEKDGTIAETKRKGKAPKHIQDASSDVDFL